MILRTLVLSSSLAIAVGALSGAPSSASAASVATLATSKGIVAAQAYARSRQGTVAFAVLDGRGRLRGLNRTLAFPSASMVKAMLMVAALRRAGAAPLRAADRELLEPMVTESDNDAAHEVYEKVGDAGLYAVARAAHMTRFAVAANLFDAVMTPADQARLFLRIDRLVPAAHRDYARKLLASIVRGQRWGIAPVAARHHMKVFFKGGWRPGLSHQVALLEKDGRRIAVAIFTSGQPSSEYGQQTLAGIARRILS